jgi:hypothetical protein
MMIDVFPQHKEFFLDKLSRMGPGVCLTRLRC